MNATDQEPASRIWPFWSAEAASDVKAKVESGRIDGIDLDPTVARFESEFRERYLRGRRAIFHSSGTAALFSCFFALNLRRGAEVLVPTNTFRATVTPSLLLGLVPIFCDAQPGSGLIDIADAERRISPRTEAIVVTHLWGQPADMDAVARLAQRHQLALVEDCSHAHGAEHLGRPVGTFGDVAAFSLGTMKMVSGGTAGLFVAKDQRLYERALVLGQPKHRCVDEITFTDLLPFVEIGLGANFRGSPLAARLALDHLWRLPQTISIKNRNVERLRQILVELLPQAEPVLRETSFTSGAYYKLPVRFAGGEQQAATALDLLASGGARVARHPTMLHQEEGFARVGATLGYPHTDNDTAAQGARPVAEQISKTTLLWDTRELYEAADDQLRSYESLLRDVARRLP